MDAVVHGAGKDGGRQEQACQESEEDGAIHDRV